MMIMKNKHDTNNHEEMELPIILKAKHSVGWYQIEFVKYLSGEIRPVIQCP